MKKVKRIIKTAYGAEIEVNIRENLLEALNDILVRHPLLTADGYNAKEYLCCSDESIKKGQEELREDICMAEIDRCMDWLELDDVRVFAKTTKSRYHSSYGLKHYVERAARSLGWPYRYISNGSFIAAALILGNEFIGEPRGNPMFSIDYASRKIRVKYGRV